VTRIAYQPRPLTWYQIPLLIPVFIVTMLFVGLPLAIVALVSIPITRLYPERHLRLADMEGTPAQKARLSQWRDAYKQLSFFDRIRRALVKSRRRRHFLSFND
jgi:hypothetical protein